MSNYVRFSVIDASYKIPSGIFDLNMAWIGSYEECINIESKLNDVKGKYCLTTIGIDSSTALKSSNSASVQVKIIFLIIISTK